MLQSQVNTDLASSPRPWGCFRLPSVHPGRSLVFPTPVGVFLLLAAVMVWRPSLPHARGGVSTLGMAISYRYSSSPRPWGCFSICTRRERGCTVFPTPVGVFLTRPPWIPRPGGLPHARGGVSLLHCQVESAGRSSPRPWGCFRFTPPSSACSGVFPTPVGVFLSAGLTRGSM